MPTAFAELPLPVHACIVDFLSIASIFSLSLTCRTLRNILSPYPLEFTLIKSSLFDRSLWQQLGNNHSLAAHVRHLAVLDEQVQMSQSNHPTRVPNPQYFGTNNTLDDGVIAEDALVRALPAMKHLERFEVHSFTNTLLLSEKFWTTLMALRPTPPAIHIYENVDIEDSSCPPGLAASEVWHHLHGLSEFHWIRETWETRTLPTESMEDMLLERCPDLENLRLHFFAAEDLMLPKLTKLFTHSPKWEKLSSLTLRGVALEADTFIPFLCAHPTIEELSIKWPESLFLDALPHTALPQLRSIKINASEPIRALPLLRAGRPIRSIEGFMFVDGSDDDHDLPSEEFFSALFLCMPVLEHLSISHWFGPRSKEALKLLSEVAGSTLVTLKLPHCCLNPKEALQLKRFTALKRLEGVNVASNNKRDLFVLAQAISTQAAPCLDVLGYTVTGFGSQRLLLLQRSSDGRIVDSQIVDNSWHS